MSAIDKMRSLIKLHIYDCEIGKEDLVHFRNLRHLEHIYIDEYTGAELQKHRDIIHHLRSKGVHVCTNRLKKQNPAAECTRMYPSSVSRHESVESFFESTEDVFINRGAFVRH